MEQKVPHRCRWVDDRPLFKRQCEKSNIPDVPNKDKSVCDYIFRFDVVPIDKIGEPTTLRTVTVAVTDCLLDDLKDQDKIDRMLYWEARKALRESKNCIYLNVSTALVDFSQAICKEFEEDLGELI